MRRLSVMAALVAIGLLGCAGRSDVTPSPGAASVPPATTAPSESAASAAPPSAAGETQAADGPWIAYQQRAANGGYGVHLVQLDGSGIHWPVSAVPGKFQEHPDWSPDGKRLVFAVTDANNTKHIWVADLDGSHAEPIVDCEAPCAWADEPAWSPDGKSIAFQRTAVNGATRTSTIERWDVSAKVAHVVITAAAGMTFYAPRWAPDGHALVAEDSTNGKTLDDPPAANSIAIIDLSGSAPTLHDLTDASRLANNPDWSPLGDLIVFCLPAPHAGFDGPADLYVMAPSGGAMRRLTTLVEAGGRAVQPTFAPDGLSVLFVVDDPAGPKQGLASVAIAGGDIRPAAGSDYIGGVHPRLQPKP
jgi:Tol biopolymer transport system component